MNPNLLVISRREAHTRGLKRYYSGEPCMRGHDCERFVANGGCVQCSTFVSPTKGKRRRPLANNQGWPARAITFSVGFVPERVEIEAAFLYAEANGWLNVALQRIHDDPKLLAQYATLLSAEEAMVLSIKLENDRRTRERIAQALLDGAPKDE